MAGAEASFSADSAACAAWGTTALICGTNCGTGLWRRAGTNGSGTCVIGVPDGAAICVHVGDVLSAIERRCIWK